MECNLGTEQLQTTIVGAVLPFAGPPRNLDVEQLRTTVAKMQFGHLAISVHPEFDYFVRAICSEANRSNSTMSIKNYRVLLWNNEALLAQAFALHKASGSYTSSSWGTDMPKASLGDVGSEEQLSHTCK